MNRKGVPGTLYAVLALASTVLSGAMGALQIEAQDKPEAGEPGVATSGATDDSVNEAEDNNGRRPTPPDIERVALDYKTFVLMTPRHVFVNPMLAASCIGVSREEVEAARVDHGPHAHTAVKIYMNELAAAAFRGKSQYSVGAVVIKEKRILRYLVRGKEASEPEGNGVGGMIKRPAGFDPENQDWEYFYFDNPRDIEAGRMPSCSQCHARARGKDFVFGSWQFGAK